MSWFICDEIWARDLNLALSAPSALQFVYIQLPSHALNNNHICPMSSSSLPSRNVHPASQVDPATHSQSLLDLLELDISREVIGTLPPFVYSSIHISHWQSEYVVDSVVETVDFAMGRKPAPPSSRGKTTTRRPEHTKFITFVTNVLSRAEVTTPTLLAALVYIDRAKPHLHIGLEQWALERVFLGSIIVASKVCFFFVVLSVIVLFIDFSKVPQRFYTKERALGSLHRRLR